MNLAEPPHGGEGHQHDFETDRVMTTAIDQPYAGRSCKELHDILNRRFRDEHNVLRLEVDVGAFLLVDLRDCHALRDSTPHTDHFTGPDNASTTQQPHNMKPHLHGLALRNGGILVAMILSGVQAGHPQYPRASTEEGCGWPKSPLAHA